MAYPSFRSAIALGLLASVPVSIRAQPARLSAIEHPGLTVWPTVLSADGTTAAGFSFPGYQAFTWTEVGGFEFLGQVPNPSLSDSNFAVGISADGSVVIAQRWRWSQARGMEPVSDVLASAVSPDGTTIVGYEVS